MKSNYFAKSAVCISALLVSAFAYGQKPSEPSKTKFDSRQIKSDEKIIHLLNRFGFGPRPGDIEIVKKIGFNAYVEQQLNPEKIDDSKVDAKLSGLTSLKMAPADIAEMERNVLLANRNLVQLQQSMAARGAMAGSDAIQGAIGAAQSGTPQSLSLQIKKGAEVLQSATPEERKLIAEGRAARIAQQRAGSDIVINKIVRATESNRQLNEVLVDFWSNHFNIDASKVRAAKLIDDQQVIRPHVLGKFRDLLKASANSAAMMIYLDNAQSVAPPTSAKQIAAFPGRNNFTIEQIRAAAERGNAQAKQVLSRIEARVKSTGETEEAAFKAIQALLPAAAPRAGLNENYARELMELHTLGVDGGYTQKDVTEVARCLTGWGIKGGRYSGEFEFHPRLHDQGEKQVLGTTIPANGGISDGEKVLEILATHPSTMRYISTKLCRRFVCDDPPKSIVDKCVETWKKTDGDIREIMKTIAYSKEFTSRSAYMSKIKSPFEYVVSSIRAVGGQIDVDPFGGGTTALASMRPTPPPPINIFTQNGGGQINPRFTAGQIGLLGEPIFNYGFPTGYPEDSSKWVSSGALIGRINFAINLVNKRINDVDMSASILDNNKMEGMDVAKQIDTVSSQIIGKNVSSQTRETILNQLHSNEKSPASSTAVVDVRTVASLLLGSPEFQRR